MRYVELVDILMREPCRHNVKGSDELFRISLQAIDYSLIYVHKAILGGKVRRSVAQNTHYESIYSTLLSQSSIVLRIIPLEEGGLVCTC